MGVFGLEFYIRSDLKDGHRIVSVEGELKKFGKQLNGKKPILVFDVMTFMGLLDKDKCEALCAGRHQKYAETLDRLFTRLSQNAELIFFLDGFIQETKFATWSRRQNQKYEKSLEIIDLINQGTPLKNIVRFHGNSIYTNTLLNVIESACDKHGQLRYTVKAECDQEMARFAFSNQRVLAVFSNDTDFMIFPGDWRYFSTKDLNLGTLYTVEFDRQGLQKNLNLTNFQMTIFATLAGNDIVQRENMRKFHMKFGTNSVGKFTSLADYIRKNYMNVQNYSLMLQFMSQEIYGNKATNNLKLLHDSIESYNVNSREDPNEDVSLNYHLHQKNVFTFNILNRSPFNFSLVFFDLRIESLPSYAELAFPMFQRQAGIVLSNSSLHDASLTVYTKLSHLEEHKRIQLQAFCPPFEVPIFAELYSDNPIHDEYRFDLLKWTISWDKLKNFELQVIPDNYMNDVLTIVFMRYQQVITSKEADIFLWTIKNVENGTVPEGLQAPNILDPRAFRLAFLFVKIFVNIARSIEVCGLKKRYSKALNFDGVFFHHEYARFKHQTFDTYAMLNEL